MKEFRFNFSITSSHSAVEPDYSGSDITEIPSGEFFEHAQCFGYNVTRASIDTVDGRYQVCVAMSEEIDIHDAASFVESFASFTTYLLSFNQNHLYGSPFIDVAYGEFYRDNGDGLRDHLELRVTRRFEIDRLPLNVPELHELVHFFFLGMQSNNVKAKYFNLFLILEALEASPLGRSMYADGTLFTENDKLLIRDAAYKLGDQRKTAVILRALSQTDDPRHVKLSGILHKLGISQFQCLAGQPAVPVTPSTIKELIQVRNRLFHKGNAIDENLLWGTLIPITRRVVTALLENPSVLTHPPVHR
ncbi:hypothetical protein CAL26_28175 [Bordetella genomosp. 9]|uniref:Apea-like HEPN domain-containing protein n=1 Tax=Bordetella genomosp. 9 TaxID=1416803 RepID=A0A261R8I1_9BORD|nr:hypothetical protein [Bordetella genomosp. 9]OZI21305.1 hypothetical protein CAL26_28175 [Bordetella genomosp. 9]